MLRTGITLLLQLWWLAPQEIIMDYLHNDGSQGYTSRIWMTALCYEIVKHNLHLVVQYDHTALLIETQICVSTYSFQCHHANMPYSNSYLLWTHLIVDIIVLYLF